MRVFAKFLGDTMLTAFGVMFEADGLSKEVLKELKQLTKDYKDSADEIKTQADKADKEIKTHGTMLAETKSKADEAIAKQGDIIARLDAVEKKAARRDGGSVDEYKTCGRQFVEHEEYKSFQTRGRGTVSIELKSVTSASAPSGQSVGTALVMPDRQAGIIQAIPNRELRIRDLLAPGSTNSNAIEWVRETLFTNAAGYVFENPSVSKPESAITFSLTSTPVATLAHIVTASKQIIADSAMLSSYIDTRMQYGLDYVEDQTLLTGDGTNAGILGLMPQSTAYAKPAGVTVQAETKIDRIRLAILQAALAEYPVTGSVMNDADWADIEMTKDSQNRYIFGNPTGIASPTLWGRPVVTSLAMVAGEFLVGAFKYCAQIFDRELTNVVVSTEDVDNFRKNMVTIRAEKRLGLAVYRRQGLISGPFVTPAT